MTHKHLKPVSWLSCLLMLASFGVNSAEIYKQVLPDGTAVYSDTPAPGAKKIEPPPFQVIESFKPGGNPVDAPETRQVNTPFYTRLQVTDPVDDEVIWSNEGTVEVAISLEPALLKEEGHTVVVLMDRKPVTEASSGTRFVLNNVFRGTHVLEATIEGPDGRVMLRSDPVTFHLRQHSVFFPKQSVR